MGERRKRRSLWDMEEETRHFSGISGHNSWTGKDRHSSHDGGRYPEFSESRPTILRKSRDHSGWPSWESIEEIPVAPMNVSFRNTRDGREMGAGKRYYENMSPGFDVMEGHSYTHDFDQSHSYRYQGRGRSRSRSRSRVRGRSRSRSLSKDRRRGRSWSRSSSRSRSDCNTKDQSRSRSPMGDYRQHFYGWSERRSSPEKPFQICREFSAGRCRRGSQCRFFHPNSLSHRDWELMEDDRAEIWRSRADLSCFPKHSYRRGSGFESRNDVSDPHYGEDERFLNKNRSAVPCKDFMRGRCRWGDACRFLHHAASDDSISRGTRNADRQLYKNGKPLCKFFAAGKCDRDNCRFSHDDRNLNNLEGRLGEAIDSGSALDRNNLWNGSTWDDAKPTGWDKTIVTKATVTGDTGNGQSDDRGGCSLEDEEKNLGILECMASSPLNNEKQPSFSGDRSSYGRDTAPTESISKENMDSKQEHFILHGSWPQNQDRIANLHEQNALLENRSVSIESLRQNTCPASHIQEQLDRITVNNVNNSSGSDALGEVKDTRYTSHPILLSEQSLNQNSGSMFPGHSSISNESDGVQNFLCPNPSNGFSTDLNVPETHFGHLNLQAQGQNNQKIVQSPGLLEARVQQILPNWLTRDHSARVTSSLVSADDQWASPATNPVSLTQRHEHYQTYSGAEAGNSAGMVPSLPDTSGYVHLVNTTNAQENPGTVSLDLFSPARNCGGNAEHSNHNFSEGMVQNNQMELERSSPLSLTAREFEGSKVKHPESPGLRKEVVANSEVTEGNKAVAEESKDVQEDKKTETLDGRRKVEEGSGKKDEKGMRVFKISLVEFVKEILKPTWKEGRMSREVHKTVVKKVVDKISSTIQVDHIPRTQDKVDHYLSYSKPKITKLVQAYVERSLKAGSRS